MKAYKRNLPEVVPVTSLEYFKKRLEEIWKDYAMADGETLVHFDMYFEKGKESQHKHLLWIKRCNNGRDTE